MTWVTKALFIYWSLLLLPMLVGCASTDSPSACNTIPKEQLNFPAAYILCEGLWHRNNSSLSRIDLTTATVYNNFFQRQNCLLQLGDTGNDLLLWKHFLYIAVTESRSIEQIDALTGQWVNRLILGDAQPRSLCILDSNRAYVTILNHDKVIEFNPRTLQRTGREVPVGAAPEQIATDGRWLYVVNSGYGDFRTNDPGANTLSVIDPTTMQQIRQIPLPPNPTTVIVGDSTILISYYHLPSLSDSIGGVIAFDRQQLSIRHHWKIRDPIQLAWDSVQHHYYVLTPSAVYQITADSLRSVVSNSSPLPQNQWYAFAVSPLDQTLWIANAKDFVSPGEIIVIDPQTTQLRAHFTVGLNPGDILFFTPSLPSE